MVLSDRDIKKCLASGAITVSNLDPNDIQPASIDLHLGDSFVVKSENVWLHNDETFKLEPHKFVLGATEEVVGLNDSILGKLEGKSSIARLGILIHVTAGYIDPGFKGQITLEMYNLTDEPIELRRGMAIGQISFEPTSSPCDRPYGCEELGSHYQNQTNATRSWLS